MTGSRGQKRDSSSDFSLRAEVPPAIDEILLIVNCSLCRLKCVGEVVPIGHAPGQKMVREEVNRDPLVERGLDLLLNRECLISRSRNCELMSSVVGEISRDGGRPQPLPIHLHECPGGIGTDRHPAAHTSGKARPDAAA